jgi:hypothetical protein
MQDVHGGKKWSMGTSLEKYLQEILMVEGRNGEVGNDSQDPCIGQIEEICSLCIELPRQPSCAPIVIVKWQRSSIMEKKSIVFSIAVTMSVKYY